MNDVRSRSASRRLLFALSLFALIAPSLSCGGLERAAPETLGLSSEGLERTRALLEAAAAEKRINGGVVLVARRGRVAYLEAAGLQDVEAGIPMRTDTIFRIASMTKPITSVAAMMLIEDGRMALADPLEKFIPEFRAARVAVRGAPGPDGKPTWSLVPAERPISIRDLLAHTSGITYRFLGRDHLAELYRRAGICDGLTECPGTIADTARLIAAQPLIHQPGSAWEYGLNTDVLGRVIEVVSGRTLEAFFRERIFEPLGMRDTAFQVATENRARLAPVYRPGPDGKIARMRGPVEMGYLVYSPDYPLSGNPYHSGGAGLTSTAADYFKFLDMLLGGGEYGGVRLLRRETVALMTSNHVGDLDIWIKSHGDGFGLGFGVVGEEFRDQGLGSIGTFSWGGFFNTYFWVDPQEELIGILMTNIHPNNHLTLRNDFRRRVYEALRPAPAAARAPRQPEALLVR